MQYSMRLSWNIKLISHFCVFGKYIYQSVKYIFKSAQYVCKFTSLDFHIIPGRFGCLPGRNFTPRSEIFLKFDVTGRSSNLCFLRRIDYLDTQLEVLYSDTKATQACVWLNVCLIVSQVFIFHQLIKILYIKKLENWTFMDQFEMRITQ